jgi:Flp pilus assembly protein TadG
MHLRPPRQHGAVAIMMAVTMLVLLAVVGLVVDAGLAYLVKARLNAAVDSAALAAARAVPEGNNQAEQIANAQKASANFFSANISPNYMLSQPKLLATSIAFNAGMVTIDVRAEAPMPVSVMQVMGFTSLTPTASAQTIRRDLDMALVVDTSGSLSGSGPAVRASAKSFLNKFNLSQDRVALIHFAAGAEIDDAIKPLARGFDRASMLKHVDGFNFSGGTSSVEGMWNARNQLNSIAPLNRSTLRVIVFFSDGAPTGMGGNFEFKDGSVCPAGSIDETGNGLYRPDVSESTSLGGKCTAKSIWNSLKQLPDWYNAHDTQHDFPIVTDTPRKVTSDLGDAGTSERNIDRAARNLAEAVANKAREENIFVFTLGMGAQLKAAGGVDKETGESVLKCMANVADGPARCYNPNKPVGMYCYAATDADLTPCFSRLASAILRISK